METHLNGNLAKGPTAPERPLRFVFFGRSIVSDWENPAAATSRAILRALNDLGHETRFLEQRANQPTIDLLRARGSAPLRAFAEDYPDIVYRTYELPMGVERTVWLARELADIDAVVALTDAPSEVLGELSRVPLPRLVRIVAKVDGAQPPFEPDIQFDITSSGPTQAAQIDARSVATELAAKVRAELARRRRS